MATDGPVTGQSGGPGLRAELHLFVKDNHDPDTTAAAADLEVEDADELERAFLATAVDGTSDPHDTPYGREVVHVDPDNNLMRFLAPPRVPARADVPDAKRSLASE